MFTFGPAVDDAIANHALRDFPRECCGAVVRGADGGEPRYLGLENRHAEPEEAFDCSAELAELQIEGVQVLAVVHSHPHRPDLDRPACFGPSAADMRQQLAMGIPWGLVVTDGTNASPPLWWGEGVPVPPLEARDYRHGPSGSDGRGDCYALIKDFYRTELGIDLPEGPRDDKWWEGEGDLYLSNFEQAGFRRVPWEELADNDVVLAHVLSASVNHGGVYVGGGLLLHHLAGKLSKKEPIHRWRQLITHVLRYEGRGGAAGPDAAGDIPAYADIATAAAEVSAHAP